MRRLAQVLVAFGSLLALGSAYMHGAVARRSVLGRLPADLTPDTLQTLNAAWMLGTAAMVTLGILPLLGVPGLGREAGAARVPCVSGVFFLVYGAWAFFYRNHHPHYFGFMAIGALLIAGALIAARRRARA